MIRFILLSILLTLLFRAISRLWTGIVQGMQGPDTYRRAGGRAGATHVPQRGVQMARDPICGTFVVPERSLAISGSNGERTWFCSATCRDQYVASRAAAPRTAPQGRTA
ncbi:MAG: hypothetical protein JSU08_04750 [Acidobacteria bacterium]|nr:hypothetical protein [Acidobacteriota bacterium]